MSRLYSGLWPLRGSFSLITTVISALRQTKTKNRILASAMPTTSKIPKARSTLFPFVGGFDQQYWLQQYIMPEWFNGNGCGSEAAFTRRCATTLPIDSLMSRNARSVSALRWERKSRRRERARPQTLITLVAQIRFNRRLVPGTTLRRRNSGRIQSSTKDASQPLTSYTSPR
jgi:hypothetical protein